MFRGSAALLATLWLARPAAAGSTREPTAALDGAPGESARGPAGALDEPAAAPASPSDLSSQTGDGPPRDPPEHAGRIGRMPGYVGLGGGAGLTARSVGDVDLRAVTGYGAVHGRLAGYSQRGGRRSRRVTVMLLPELQLDLELGGTASTPPSRHGVMLGASGLFAIGAAWASSGRVGVYAHVHAAQRFQARLHTDLEGAHVLAAPGLTAGLRVSVAHAFTMLLGGGADGWIGAQRFVDRARLVAQLAPVGQLAVHSEPRNVYFGVVGRAGATALGQRYGGSRVQGRVTAEVMWRVSRTGGIKLACVLLTYDGGRVVAPAGHPQFDPAGERRTSHQLLLAGGAAF